ncbi:MAG: methyltransferase domain-containing protein [Candidatus Sericytochromatia bacterium]
MDEITFNYYKKNFEQFIKITENINMNDIYKEFIPLLASKSKILDVGCGSGRDSIYFHGQGYKVTAIDNCIEFIEHLKKNTDIEVYQMSFEEIHFKKKFDLIWACASLLHIKKEKLPEIISKIFKYLNNKGFFYLSFKYGSFSGERNGRIFTDMNENEFNKILEKIKGLKVIKYWHTVDQRPERNNEKWLNILLQKEV